MAVQISNSTRIMLRLNVSTYFLMIVHNMLAGEYKMYSIRPNAERFPSKPTFTCSWSSFVSELETAHIQTSQWVIIRHSIFLYNIWGRTTSLLGTKSTPFQKHTELRIQFGCVSVANNINQVDTNYFLVCMPCPLDY